jgi:hypothetical protein
MNTATEHRDYDRTHDGRAAMDVTTAQTGWRASANAGRSDQSPAASRQLAAYLRTAGGRAERH